MRDITVQTHMVDRIYVADLNPRSIGLILNYDKHAHRRTNPYSVPMIINVGTERGGVDWISVIINIHPQSTHINYTINLDAPVSFERELELKTGIEEGIRFAASPYEAYPNSSEVTGEISRIRKPEPILRAGAGYKVLYRLCQDDSLSGATLDSFKMVEDDYRAIKRFVYETQLRTIQLPPVDLLPNNKLGLSAQVLADFDSNTGRIRDEIVEQKILSVVPKRVGSSQHALVTAQVDALQPGSKKITFPGDPLEEAVTSVDFEDFLLLVQKRLPELGVNKTLNEIQLVCSDNAALEGLIAYGETKRSFPAQCLILNLDKAQLHLPNQRKLFLSNLKLMLLTLSEGQLSELQFIDNSRQLDDGAIADLTQFITNKLVSINITLPNAFSTSPMQRQIDDWVSDNIRQRDIDAFTQQRAVEEASVAPVRGPNPRRRVETMGQQNLVLDIDMAADQAQDQARQTAQAVATDAGRDLAGAGPDAGTTPGLSRVDFIAKFRAREFDVKSKSYLVIETDEVLTKLWCNWVGALSIVEASSPSGLKLTQAACEELLAHQDQFQYGLDLKNLPAGFSIKPVVAGRDQMVVHFDENLKQLAEYNPLQVQAIDLPGPLPLTSAQLRKWLRFEGYNNVSNQIKTKFSEFENEHLPYDKQALRVFKCYLPQMLQLDSPQIGRLFDACTDPTQQPPKLDMAKIAFLLDNSAKLKRVYDGLPQDEILQNKHVITSMLSRSSLVPHDTDPIPQHVSDSIDSAVNFIVQYQKAQPAFADHLLALLVGDEPSVLAKIENLIAQVPTMNLNALLQVYSQLGEAGIDKFTSLVNIDVVLFNDLYIKVFANAQNHMPLLNDEYVSAIKAISGFTPAERVWWDTLLSQHCAAQTDVNLIDLVKAFKMFKDALEKLPPKPPLAFPPTCTLTDVKSLPVALSRLLTLLQHTKEQDRKAQWLVADQLDLSSNGMVKAVSDTVGKPWAFITPQMHLNAQHEAALVPANPNLRSYRKPEKVITSADQTLPQINESFFRFAACQKKNEQLPLEFYQHVEARINGSGLPELAQKYLYSLLGHASTTARSVALVKSLAGAKKDVDDLLTLIVDMSFLPVLCTKEQKEMARINLLESMYMLEDTPPLPILNRLVNLIASSLNSIPKIFQNKERLDQANIQLARYVKAYAGAVYDGMADYVDEDYRGNSELFFNHLAIIARIDLARMDLARIDPDLPETKVSEASYIMRLISTFRLTLETIDPIIAAFLHMPPPPDYNDCKEVLYLLAKLSIQGPNQARLRASDVLFILNAVRDRAPGCELIDVIRTLVLPGNRRLADYFPPDYLSNYGKIGIPEALLGKIAQHFISEEQQAQIKKILLHFAKPDDSGCYEANVVDKLIKICEKLSPVEKAIFINKLAESKGLYRDLTHEGLAAELKGLNDPDNDFVQLLDWISANSPNEFINFIASERSLLRDTPQLERERFFVRDNDEWVVAGLAKKAVFYLTTALPALQAIPNPSLSQLDLTPRLTKIILKTPIAQMSAILDARQIDRHEAPSFETQLDSLTQILQDLDREAKINFKQAAEDITRFIDSGVLAESASCAIYNVRLNNIKEKPDISGVLFEKLSEEPCTLIRIFFYQRNPDSVDPAERKRFDAILEKLKSEHPYILINEKLVHVLFKNPQFGDALAEPSILDDISASDLLDNDEKLSRVFTAMEEDIKAIAAFKSQTEALQQELATKKADLYNYSNVLTAIHDMINSIVTVNPSSRRNFLELFDRYLEGYNPATGVHLDDYLFNFVDTLQQHFAKTSDKNLVLSLCLQFCSDTNPELAPENLLLLFQFLGGVVPALNRVAPELDTSFILKIAVELINNEKGYSTNAFGNLCREINQDTAADPNAKFAKALAKIYDKAPMPTITQVLAWHAEANNRNAVDSREQHSAKYAAKMDELYNQFGRRPCHREEVNGFKISKAEEQLAKFEGLSPDSINACYFEIKTTEMRDKTPDELLQIFRGFKDKTLTDLDYYTLVAVAAELLHRSKGKDDKNADDSYKLGSSMEINTTQYLAILSLLKTPGHVTSQIGTGEGKSRIMMISLACQFALGNTVDFVTADAQLAIRDLVEFKTYFDMIGAKTSMIFANTDPSEYQLGGINFSDPSNISLFRNKARTLVQDARVLDPRPEKRALLLDEADKTYFDVADTRFNYSTDGDSSTRDMKWVYPLLMAYFAQKNVLLTAQEKGFMGLQPDGDDIMTPLRLYHEDIDLSREKFLQFAHGKCPATQMMQLKALSYEQIEQWQVSAVNASRLKFKDRFVIEPDVLISTPDGAKISSEALLLFENRVAKGAKFSFGVQQCLHARLEISRQNLDAEPDEKLREALRQCEQEFYIADEKRIIYSSTSKNLLDDYQHGTLKAVTGTAGALSERQEAAELYGLSTEHTVQKMSFIKVPRDNDLIRRDKAIRLTRNEDQQFKVLIEEIKEARRKNQPILIVAENDNESELLFHKLNAVFRDGIQHVHSQLSKKVEDERVAEAGKPQQITVSTAMIGRGTDIALKGMAKERGLHVMLTYLPRVRDLEQIIGRSGRFGAEGETVMILDKKRTEKAVGKELPPQYYARVEGYIKQEQAIMDRNKQLDRVIKITVSDFRSTFNKQFFKNMLNQVDETKHEQLKSLWNVFYAKTDIAWNASWPLIKHELAADVVDRDQVNALLDKYKDDVQKLWAALRRDVNNLEVQCKDGRKPVDLLMSEVPPVALTPSVTAIVSSPAPKQGSLGKAREYNLYDRGHDGRAVKYTSWTIPFMASLKGYANLLPFVNFENARPPFANFRAWWRGEGQLFPNFRASTNKGKIVGAMGFGLIGAGVGAALAATGVLAPIGLPILGFSLLAVSIASFAGIGFAVGSLLGLGGGAVIDAVSYPSGEGQEEVVDDFNRSHAVMAGLGRPKADAGRNVALQVDNIVATEANERQLVTHDHVEYKDDDRSDLRP